MFWLELKQAIAISLKALLANKARSFLTMFGIIIGVAAVIIIVSVGAGAQNLILSQVKDLGGNLIGVLPGKAEENGPPASVMGIVVTTLTYEDALAIGEKRNVPNIKEVAAYSRGVGTVSWGANSYDTNLNGTTVGYLQVEKGEVESGRFFTREEESGLARVAVLGSTVKKEIFGESDPIGQRIKIKKRTFEVIGVMAERGTVAFQDYDDQVLIPIKTMQRIILGVSHVGMIRAEVDEEANIENAIEDMAALLRARHDISDQTGNSDDFSVRSAAQAMDMLETITNALRFFLAAMAALSLLVGGIGIMNIMLISVTERTKEIGLRKAVGADNLDIMSQFLLEAVVITLFGGILGIVAGAFISLVAAFGIRWLGYEWEYIISLASIAVAVLVAASVGLIFGLYPARRASKLQPVEALRYE